MLNSITRLFADTGEIIQNKETPNGNWQTIFDQSVPPGIDTHYDVTIKRSEILAMALTCDNGCIVGTNGAVFSSPPAKQDLWEPQGGSPTSPVYVWTLAQDGLSAGAFLVECPISGDVTGIYVTNNSSPPVNCRLKIKVLRNA